MKPHLITVGLSIYPNFVVVVGHSDFCIRPGEEVDIDLGFGIQASKEVQVECLVNTSWERVKACLHWDAKTQNAWLNLKNCNDFGIFACHGFRLAKILFRNPGQRNAVAPSHPEVKVLYTLV